MEATRETRESTVLACMLLLLRSWMLSLVMWWMNSREVNDACSINNEVLSSKHSPRSKEGRQEGMPT